MAKTRAGNEASNTMLKCWQGRTRAPERPSIQNKRVSNQATTLTGGHETHDLFMSAVETLIFINLTRYGKFQRTCKRVLLDCDVDMSDIIHANLL
jgi:hypothetical protein